MKITVAGELYWEFDDNKPYVYYGGLADFEGYHHHHRVNVYPDPAYSHNIHLVRKWADKTEASLPLKHSPGIYILEHEFVGRTNGFADRSWNYSSEETPKEWAGHIVLSAKTIPILPAMTRYLVAHEYGHNVEWELARVRHMYENENAVRDEYMKLPGRNGSHEYGRGKWHSNIGELFANDFRILVAETETDFWPHPGFPHPHDAPDVEQFWLKATSDILEANKCE